MSYKYPGNYVASFQNLRDLKTTVDQQLTTKKNTNTFDQKIQHSSTNAEINCSGPNQIDLKVNGVIKGQIFQPLGQATQPLGISSNDKLQLQSQLSSTSIYGSKAIDQSPLVLNTHGLYVTGLDSSTANVQSTVNVSQGQSQLYISAGHANAGQGQQDFCAITSNKKLQISGGVSAGISDKQLILYAGSESQALPIVSDGPMGYQPSSNVAITQATQFVTKAFVESAVAAGGGSGALPDEIKNNDSSTSVKTVAGGVQIRDDTTLITTISKDSVATKIKGELDGVVIATNDLQIKTKDESSTIVTFNNSQIQTTASILQNATQGQLDAHLTRKDYVDQQITTAKQNVTQLVDANTGETPIVNKYKLKIDNDQLEFSRDNNPTEDTWLKLFGSTVNSSDAVVSSTNRSNFYDQTEDSLQADVNYYLTHKQDLTSGSTYMKSAPLRLSAGTSNTFTTPFTRVSAINVESGAGNANTSIVIHPKNSMTSTIVNKVNVNNRVGYTATADLTQQDANSVLARSECDTRYLQATTPLNLVANPVDNVSMNNFKLMNVADATNDRDAVSRQFADGRYYQNITRLDQIVTPQLPVSMNNQRISNLSPATQLTDAVNFNQLQNSRHAYSTVRKTTTALTVNSKVTGFTLSEEFNASQNCYWDNANQTFLITTAVNDTIRVKFTCVVKFGISATGNTATLVLRDFTNSSNYVDTTMTCAQQNQTGTYERVFTVIKSFNTNRFVGLYCTAFNGGFSSLDVTFTAETVFISTAINKLENATGTQSIAMGGSGLDVQQAGQNWFMNGANIYGTAVVDSNSDFDVLVRKDYVDGEVSGLLLQADGYRFKPSGVANAFAIEKVSNGTQPFVIQTDLTNASILTVQNDLRLAYSGVKTLTDNSLISRADVLALIQSQGVRQSYVAYIHVGDFPPDATFAWDSSPSGLITSIGRTNTASVQSIDINHSAIPFRHRVFITKFSLQFSTNDNDESTQWWVIDPEPSINRTQTRLCYEQLSETVAQNIGINVQWVQW